MLALLLAATLQTKVLEGRIAEAMGKTGTHALAVAVVDHDQIVYRRTFGAPAGTRFYLASASKSLTALAARQLAAEGKLDLDAPLTSTLPQLHLPPPLDPARMSVRDLLAHRLGFSCDPVIWRTSYSGEWTDDAIFSILAKDATVTPRVFRYDNLGYILTTYAAEHAAGQPWNDVLRTRVLIPAGMTETKAEPCIPTKSARTMNRGAGGLCSTLADMTRWLKLNMSGGVLDGRRVVDAAVMREVHAPQIDLQKKFGRIDRTAYALGWYHGTVDGNLLMHHFGSFPGAWAHVSWMPERSVGVVVLADDETPLPDAVALLAYDLLAGKSDAVDRFDTDVQSIVSILASFPEKLQQFSRKIAPPPDQPSRAAASLAGVYVDEAYGSLVVAENGGTLTIRSGDLTAPLVGAGGDVYFVQWLPRDAPDRVTFTSGGLEWRGRTLVREE